MLSDSKRLLLSLLLGHFLKKVNNKRLGDVKSIQKTKIFTPGLKLLWRKLLLFAAIFIAFFS